MLMTQYTFNLEDPFGRGKQFGEETRVFMKT
jgi:hypothetical protein